MNNSEPNHKHRNFKGQLPDEAIVCFTRKHWVQLFPYIFTALLVCVFALYLPFLVGRKELEPLLTSGGFFVLSSIIIGAITYALHYIFTKIFNYYLRIILITNQRVIDLNKTLFINDQRLTIMLSEIQDISMERMGIMQTIFNYGTINIVISGVTKTKPLHRIPNPDYHFRKIVQARQEYMNRLATVTRDSAVNVTENIYAQQNAFRPLPVEAPELAENVVTRERIFQPITTDAVLPLQ